MANENPYEKNDSVEVPSFVESKEEVDMSVFRLDETGETAEVEYREEDDDEEEYDEEEGGRKLNLKVVIPLVCSVVFLALAAVGLMFGFSQRSKYAEMKTKYDELVATSSKQVSDLNSQIKALQAEIETMKASSTPSVPAGDPANTNGTKYTVTAETGLRVRKGAGTGNDPVGSVAKGTVVTVTETKSVDGGVWGKIREGEWICLSLNGEEYAKKN